MRFEIKCIGNFRQELEVLGQALGVAATSYNCPKYDAVVIQTNGLEASDGSQMVDIIIETDPNNKIDYYGSLDPDILVIMDLQIYDTNTLKIGKEGTIILDPDITYYYAKFNQSHTVYEIPALVLSKKFNTIYDLSSIIMLGFIMNHLHFLKPNSISMALKSIIPRKLQDVYINALTTGMNYKNTVLH